MVKLEEAKGNVAIDERMVFLKQLRKSSNMEMIKCCAADESSQVFAQATCKTQEVAVEDIKELIRHERAEWQHCENANSCCDTTKACK